jgi:hypothetical protein
MNAIIAAFLSNPRLAGPAKSQTLWHRVWEGPDLKVVIAFSLVGLLATALYMATQYPLPEDSYMAPITVTGP